MPRIHTDELERIWSRDIKDRVFDKARPEEYPRTIVLGAQPGAGKTASRTNFLDETFSDGQVTVLDADALRQFHPDYLRLMRDNPQRMSSATAHAASFWRDKAVTEANLRGYSILVETAFKHSERALSYARQAHGAGRGTVLVVIATPPSVSRAAIVRRYALEAAQGRGRWVAPLDHDMIAANLSGTLSDIAAAGLFDGFCTMSRNGRLLYEGPDASGFLSSWRNEFERPLTEREREYIHVAEGIMRRFLGSAIPADEESERTMRNLSITSIPGNADRHWVSDHVRNGYPVAGHWAWNPGKAPH